MTVNLVKLCVGVDTVDGLRQNIDRRMEHARKQGREAVQMHPTRMRPKRADDVLDGGSLYWVIKGHIVCRQRVLELRELASDDGLKRCGIVLEPVLHPVLPVPRRPFQGWRYLEPDDSPADLTEWQGGDLPPHLMAELAALGLA